MKERGFHATEDLRTIFAWVLENGTEEQIKLVLLTLHIVTESISLQTGLANPFADVIAGMLRRERRNRLRLCC